MIKKIFLLILLFCNTFMLFSCNDNDSKINTKMIKVDKEFDKYEDLCDFVLNDIIIYNETKGYTRFCRYSEVSKINLVNVKNITYHFCCYYTLQDDNNFLSIDNKLCINIENYIYTRYENFTKLMCYVELTCIDNKTYIIEYPFQTFFDFETGDKFFIYEKNGYNITLEQFNNKYDTDLFSEKRNIVIRGNIFDALY